MMSVTFSKVVIIRIQSSAIPIFSKIEWNLQVLLLALRLTENKPEEKFKLTGNLISGHIYLRKTLVVVEISS